jgi:hypothetical protein
MDNPDFYLASTDSYRLEEPRRCKSIKQLRSDSRDDLLLVKIEPPLIGQPFGLGAKDIDTVMIATRHKGESLFPIKNWPVFVHVARLLISRPEDQEQIHDNEFESIAWAELYPTEAAAKAKLGKSNPLTSP